MATGDTGGGNWLARAWPILSQASGVTVLVMLVMLGLVYVELRRVHRHNETLVERLFTTQEQQRAWFERHVRCEPPPRQE